MVSVSWIKERLMLSSRVFASQANSPSQILDALAFVPFQYKARSALSHVSHSERSNHSPTSFSLDSSPFSISHFPVECSTSTHNLSCGLQKLDFTHSSVVEGYNPSHILSLDIAVGCCSPCHMPYLRTDVDCSFLYVYHLPDCTASYPW